MAIATTNFDAGLVQLAIQNGSVYSTQRPVAPTFAMLLGNQPEMSDNIIANVKGVPVYGGLSSDELDSGIIRTYLSNQTTAGGSVARGSINTPSGLGAASTPVQNEVLNDLVFKTCYYSEGGQTLSLHRQREGQGRGWAAGQTYEQILATAMVEKYITDRSSALFATGATALPDDGQFGSLRAMISNALPAAASQTNESAYANYGNLARGTGGTTITRSQYLYHDGSAFSESLASRACLLGFANAAQKLIAPMSIGRFAAFELELRQRYGRYFVDEEMMTMINGGQCIKAFGCTFYPEPAILANTTYQLFVDLGSPGKPNAMAKTAMQKSEVEHIKNPALVGADRLRWVFPDQCIVRNPKSCVLVENILAA
jgi:hypothetical protein